MKDSDEKMLWNRDEDFYRGIDESGKHTGVDSGTGTNKRGEYIPSGFHHVVFICKDIGETVRFYEETLGMKLRAIIPMHGVDGAKHCFIEAGNGCELSFIEFANGKEFLPNELKESAGITHHMAFKANSLQHLYNLRKQVENTDIFVSPVISHGFVHSFYFFDPNNIQLEVTYTVKPYSKADFDISLLTNPVKLPPENFSWEKAVEEADQYRKKYLKSKL